MARYDVYRSPDGYMLDVQTDLLDDLDTRIVVPLLPVGQAPKIAKFLNPSFEIDGDLHMLAMQYLAAVPASVLKVPVHSLANRADEVTRALDMLFHGF